MKPVSCVLLCSLIGLSLAQTKDSDRMQNRSFKTSFGVTLNYLLFIPKTYTATQKYPLVVTLHSAGSDYIYQVDNNDQAHPWIEDSVQARWPHFIMAPGLPAGSSSWGGMMGAGTSLSQEARAVVEAVEDLKKQYALDTNRFIVGGFSIGGAGTYHLLQFMPNYWAAGCPVGAGGDSSKIDLIAKTPIWHHQGSNDNSGAALIRMATALTNHRYPVLRVTCDMVVNTPAAWQREIQRGTKPEDIIFKNAKPSYDSICKAVEAGERYVFQMINGATHEDSRLNANHNILLATWAFSKTKGAPTSVVPLPIRPALPGQEVQQQAAAMLMCGNGVRPVGDRVWTLLGQVYRTREHRNNYGVRIAGTVRP